MAERVPPSCPGRRVRARAARRRALAFEGLEGRRVLAAGWPLGAGGAGDDVGDAIAMLPDGSAVVVGRFEGTATFGTTTLSSAGASDIVIARIGADGAVAWAIRAGGAGMDEGMAVSRVGTGSAVILTGSYDSSATFGPITLAAPPGGATRFFAARVEGDGSVAWATAAGGAGPSHGAAVVTLADGSSIVTGGFAETASFGSTLLASAGESDLFVARLSAGGQIVWAKRAGGTGQDTGTSLAATPTGAIAVAGSFEGSASFGAVAVDSQGGSDAVFFRITPAGQFGWVRRAGGPGDDVPAAIAGGTDGSFVAAGLFHGSAGFGATTLESVGSSDAFFTRLSASGTFAWALRAGGEGADAGRSIAAVPGGSFLVAGIFAGSVAFGDVPLASVGGGSGFVARLSPAGQFAWATAVDAAASGRPVALAPLADGAALVTGGFGGSAFFGGTTLAATGAGDLFVAKIGSDGSFDLPPGAPLLVKGKSGDGLVTLSWSAPITDGSQPPTAWVVEYRVANGRVPIWLGTSGPFPSAERTRTVTGLANGVPHLFRVRAVNDAGAGPFSAPSPPITPRAVPGAPAGLRGRAGDGQATLSWKAPRPVAGARVTGYTLQWSSDDGATWTALPGTIAVPRATVGGLTDGVPYRFRVAAINASGTGAFSALSATIVPFTRPGVPRGLAVTAVAGGVTLSWAAPESDGGRPLTGYRILHARQVGDGFGPWKAIVHPAGLPTSRVVSGLAGGHTYRFRIAAENLRGTGAFSADVPVALEPSLATDFTAGSDGWKAGVVDLPKLGGAEYGLDWGRRVLPAGVGPGKGFMLQGHNRSDDLFLFLARRLDTADGIRPGASYRLSFTITLASDAPSGGVGIGGAPGESVFLKAGGAGVEPKRVLDGDGWWRLNVDKGNQSVGGTAATVAGDIANGREPEAEVPYVSIVRRVTHAATVQADARGRLWLLVGIDSGFEGLTRIYLERIAVTLTEARG